MISLISIKASPAVYTRAVSTRRHNVVPIVRCAATTDSDSDELETKPSNPRVEKLKEAAKHALAERRKTCGKAVDAVQSFFEAERDLQKKFFDEVVTIIKQDARRIQKQIGRDEKEKKKTRKESDLETELESENDY